MARGSGRRPAPTAVLGNHLSGKNLLISSMTKFKQQAKWKKI
jgi:hypothetical protein